MTSAIVRSGVAGKPDDRDLIRLRSILAGKDPDGMHQSRDVSEHGQQDVDPEMHAEADFEEDADRRDDNGEDDANQICHMRWILGWKG